MPDNKGIRQLWGYDLIDSKARNAISDTRSSLENNFQKKTDDTLGTTSKTIPGAINEIKDSVDNLDGKFSVEQTDTKYDMKYNGKTIANIGLTLTDDQIAGGDGSFNIDLTPYQTKTDTSLTTNDKTISGAIKELNTQYKENAKQLCGYINIFPYCSKLKDIDFWEKTISDGDKFELNEDGYILSTTNNKPMIISTPINIYPNVYLGARLNIKYKSNKDCCCYILFEQKSSKNFYNKHEMYSLQNSNGNEVVFSKDIDFASIDSRIELRFDHTNNNAGYLNIIDISIEPKQYKTYIDVFKDNNYIYMQDYSRRADEDSANDDSGRLMRAIKIAELTGQSIVLEKNKTYHLNNNIQGENITLIGANATFYIKNTADVTEWVFGIYLKNSVIKNVNIKGINNKVNGLRIEGKSKVVECSFLNMNIGARFRGLIDCKDCRIYDNKIGIQIDYTENIIDNLHGYSQKCILLNGEGNRITNCKLHGDGLVQNKPSICGIEIRGSRNIISNCYFDRHKQCAILVNDAKDDFLNTSIESYTGAWGNKIHGCLFYNNGHGEVDNYGSWDKVNNVNKISSHIVFRIDNTDGKLLRNTIINNTFETGTFIGWNDDIEETKSDITSTKYAIHFIGQGNESIKDNIIALNSYGNNLLDNMLWVNSLSTNNTIM